MYTPISSASPFITRDDLSKNQDFRTIKLLGLPIFAASREVWRRWLAGALEMPSHAQALSRPNIVFTPNAEQLVQAAEDSQFAACLQQADILLPDGIGPVLASYYLDRHHPIEERLAGADVVGDVLVEAAVRQLRVLVVGGRKYGVVTQAGYGAIRLPLEHTATLEVAWTPGYVDVSHPTRSEEATIQAVITSYQPDIVLVAFGAPAQERWAIEHHAILASVGTRLVMVVGGAIDFLLGKIPRAPQIMRQFGLEWLFRLCLQPWRWRRQLRLVRFVTLMLKK